MLWGACKEPWQNSGQEHGPGLLVPLSAWFPLKRLLSMCLSGALNISVSHQLRMEKKESWFSLLPWVSYIRPSGMMQLFGAPKRCKCFATFLHEQQREEEEERTASWVLFCGCWCETRAEFGLGDLDATFKICPAISLASSGAIVLQWIQPEKAPWQVFQLKSSLLL